MENVVALASSCSQKLKILFGQRWRLLFDGTTVTQKMENALSSPVEEMTENTLHFIDELNQSHVYRHFGDPEAFLREETPSIVLRTRPANEYLQSTVLLPTEVRARVLGASQSFQRLINKEINIEDNMDFFNLLDAEDFSRCISNLLREVLEADVERPMTTFHDKLRIFRHNDDNSICMRDVIKCDCEAICVSGPTGIPVYVTLYFRNVQESMEKNHPNDV